MLSTTSGYVPENTTHQQFEPCSRDGDNSLGAHLSFLYYFMFVFSVVTNVLVLVIIRWFDKMNTVVNIMLMNLVVSSLIFMSSLPFLGIYMQLSNWIFGSVMCKVIFSVYYLGFYSSVFFLTLLTFDRYLAIVYLMPTIHIRSRHNAIIACTVVWLISGLACIRPMLLHNSHRFLGTEYCEEYFRDLPNIDLKMLKKSGFYIQLFVFLILPLAVNIFCYIRIAITVISTNVATKNKAFRMIFVIVVLFFISWIPFNIVELLNEEPKDCKEQQRLGYALHVTRNMAYFYFCVSPVFYTFVGKRFQDYFKQLLVKYFPSLRKHISINGVNKTTMFTAGTELSVRY
ncbi:hypothetical protein GOODEAATRI_024885 [Goodea atripinnis]|uniref:G-protein coupled receptors family 1 profile domain-containing protein n=1 Tax=Goodea atripinnis TaxID=208336 RepID=A0ABV0MUW6_9TELE